MTVNRMALAALGMALAALVVPGCSSQTPLTRAHGRASAEYLKRQAVRPSAHHDAVKGLDSEEAAIVADAYRKGLAPKGARTDADSQVLLLAPPQRGERPAPLAPSVPKE